MQSGQSASSEPGSGSITRFMLPVGLVVLGVVLLLTSIAGVFIVDENHQLASVRALSQGRLDVPDFDGLTWSPELVSYHPAARSRVPGDTSTTVPPLYAFLALPFYLMGFTGLVALNILAYLATGVMVFFLTRRYCHDRRAPWLAMLTFFFAGYAIEYAQGVWPHMLSAALCMAGVLLVSRVRDGGALYLALIAGVAGGMAAGVRYQNVVFASAVGVGLAIWGRKRLRSTGLYVLGMAGPLVASSAINHARFGIFHPFTKGAQYLVPGQGEYAGNRILEGVWLLWTKVVDFSAHPPVTNSLHRVDLLMQPDPDTGAFLLLGKALKKSWLQSCPWIALSLVALLVVWWLYRRRAPGGPVDSSRWRELKAYAVIVGCMLGMFAFAGFRRYDGMCFNQRYFMDMVPLLAVVLAWTLADVGFRLKPLLLGGLASGLLVLVLLLSFDPANGVRQLVLVKLPIVLAGLSVVAWLLSRKDSWQKALSVIAGACLGWSLMVHLGEDLATTGFIRAWRGGQAKAIEGILPEGPAAVFAYWGYKDGLGPLQMDHDLVIADPWIDHGQDAGRLAGELLSSGRRVFVLAAGFPKKVFDSMVEGRRVRMVTESPYPIFEVAEARRSPEESGDGTDR